MWTLVNVMENINCYDLMLTKLTPALASQWKSLLLLVQRTEPSFSYHFACRNVFQLTRFLLNGKTEETFSFRILHVKMMMFILGAKNIILIIKCENK